MNSGCKKREEKKKRIRTKCVLWMDLDVFAQPIIPTCFLDDERFADQMLFYQCIQCL